MFIGDPGFRIWIFHITDPGVEKAPYPGSGYVRQNECGLFYPYLSISSVVTPTWMALAASSKTYKGKDKSLMVFTIVSMTVKCIWNNIFLIRNRPLSMGKTREGELFKN